MVFGACCICADLAFLFFYDVCARAVEIEFPARPPQQFECDERHYNQGACIMHTVSCYSSVCLLFFLLLYRVFIFCV